MDRNKLFSATALPAPFSLRIMDKISRSETNRNADKSKKAG